MQVVRLSSNVSYALSGLPDTPEVVDVTRHDGGEELVIVGKGRLTLDVWGEPIIRQLLKCFTEHIRFTLRISLHTETFVYGCRIVECLSSEAGHLSATIDYGE